MSWQHGLTVPAGAWIQATSNGGVNLDLFGSIGETQILERIRSYASLNWSALAVVQVDAFSFAIVGKTSAETPAVVIESDIANAINSFWLYALGSVTVRYSTDSSIPPVTSDSANWSGSIKFASIAVVALVGLYVYISLRKGL